MQANKSQSCQLVLYCGSGEGPLPFDETFSKQERGSQMTQISEFDYSSDEFPNVSFDWSMHTETWVLLQRFQLCRFGRKPLVFGECFGPLVFAQYSPGFGNFLAKERCFLYLTSLFRTILFGLPLEIVNKYVQSKHCYQKT